MDNSTAEIDDRAAGGLVGETSWASLGAERSGFYTSTGALASLVINRRVTLVRFDLLGGLTGGENVTAGEDARPEGGELGGFSAAHRPLSLTATFGW